MALKSPVLMVGVGLLAMSMGWMLGGVSSQELGPTSGERAELEMLRGRYRAARARIEELERREGETDRLAHELDDRRGGDRSLPDPEAARSRSEREGPHDTGSLSSLDLFQLEKLGLFPEELWEPLHRRGDLEGMLNFATELSRALRTKLDKSELPDDERDQLRLRLSQALYRRGYADLALGNGEEARESFEESLELLDSMEREGAEVDVPHRIYGQRTSDLLEAVEQLHGRRSPVDFHLGDHWVSEEQPYLTDLEGKSVAIFFRQQGDFRSRELLRPLTRFASTRPEMELIQISPRNQDLTFEEERVKLRGELDSIEFRGAASFDPDPNLGLFRSFRASNGSASLYILDSTGKVVWIQGDPTSRDLGLVKKLLGRAAGS